MAYIILRGKLGFTANVSRHLHVTENTMLQHHSFKLIYLQKTGGAAWVKPFE